MNNPVFVQLLGFVISFSPTRFMTSMEHFTTRVATFICHPVRYRESKRVSCHCCERKAAAIS